MTDSTKKELVFLVEIEVHREPSHLDDMIRGRPLSGPIRGAITSRRSLTEEYPILAGCRDEAISIFRVLTHWRGSIESVKPLRTRGQIDDALRAARRSRERKILHVLDEELEKVEAHLDSLG